MHLDAQIEFRIEGVGDRRLIKPFIHKITALGGNAARLDCETWLVDKVATAENDGLTVTLCGTSSGTPIPDSSDTIAAAVGRDWRARSQRGEIAIVRVDMDCGNPLLDIVKGMAKLAGAMRLHGHVWINPIDRWLIHTLKIAAFPAYEGYVQIDGGRVVALLQDQVPPGNIPFNLNPATSYWSKPPRPAQNYGIKIDL